MDLILSILYALLVISLIVVIISENRNPLKATSWLLVITLIPIAGILLYFLFGQDQRRRHIMNRRVYKRLMRRPKFLSIPNEVLSKMSDSQITPLMRLLKRNSDNPVLFATQSQIFTDGKSKISSLLEDIKMARNHIHIQYYIIENDEYGNELADQLIEKAKQGVRVRLIYDHVGCWNTKRSFWEKLRKGGVEVYPFMPVVFPLFTSRVNYRNHRKLVIIDGKIGYFGGMNIAKRYIDGNKLGLWHDTHIRIEGSAVASLQTSFLIDWYVVSRRVINIEGCFHGPDTPTPKETDIPMQIIPGGPIGEWRSLEQAITFLMSRATKYVYITTPYFLPTETLSNAITTAALAGIEVRLLIPKKSDTKFAQVASLSYIQDMLSAGVKVFFYTGGFLHAKMVVVDDKVASVGSTNMDFRSLEHNFELNAMIYKPEMVIALKNCIIDLLNDSEKIEIERWQQRSRFQKFMESCIRLFAPLL